MGRHRRRSWVGHGRAHVEVRGIQQTGRGRAARTLERELTRLDGVDWAAVNQITGRVVAAFDPDQVDVDDLVDVVEAVEEAHGLTEQPLPAAVIEHPADTEPLRRAQWALAADVVGSGLSLFTRALRANPLSAEAAALVGLVESTPALRRPIEQGLGPVADAALATAHAAAQSLAGTPLSLVVDAAHRALSVQEIRARHRAWAAREPELHGGPDARQDALDLSPRPVRVPEGLVERYARRSAIAGVTGAAAAVAATRDPRLAVAATVAGGPKAARLGKEAFAAALGRLLADHGVVPMDPAALRRLDLVDTVVLDGDVLLTGEFGLGAVWVPEERAEDEAALWLVGRMMFEPEAPFAVQEAESWHLGPLSDADDVVRGGPAWAAGRALDHHSGGGVLALRDESGVAALLEVHPRLAPLARAVVSAARQVGEVYVAGRRAHLDGRLDVALRLRGDNYLATEVRRLQEEGRVVAVVSARRHAALAAADVGIGLHRSGSRTPWGADLLTSRGLLDAWLVLESVPVARLSSHRSVACATYGAGAAGLLALAGPRRGATARAGVAVSAASAVSIGAAAWAARSLGQRPDPVREEASDWHAMAAQEALDRLGSGHAGLTNKEAEQRGDGGAEPAGGEDVSGIARAALEELANPLTPALATGAGLSAALGSVADAGLISTVMGLNALIGGIQRVGADRAVQRLLDASATRVHVRRDRVEVLLPADEVVVGDVLVLRAGDGVPADCRIVATDGVEVDEATLTGESQLVTKSADPSAAATVADRRSMLYAGTAVAAGEVTGVVVATGDETEVGRSTRLVAGQRRVSGVEARLRRLTAQTVPISLGAGVALLAGGALHGRPLVRTLSTGVGLAVAAVPEGLPLVATVAQLAAARRLSARGVLVRHASTIEALGRVDILCADKTGTLTTGKISVHSVSDGTQEQPLDRLDEAGRAIVAAGLRASPTPTEGRRVAHPTDNAVIKAAREVDVAETTDAPGWRVDSELPFEPSRGYHAVLGRFRGGRRLAVKGAPEVVLPRCTTWRRPEGSVPLDEAAGRTVHDEIDRLARRGYRVLVVAERAATSRRDLDDGRVNRLELVGLLAMGDPVRPSAAAAVAGLQAAGVRVTMLTGDHPSTAQAIAADLGLLDGRGVMTGPELSALSDDALAERIGSVAVFARVTPEQKVRIVHALQRGGSVVAMTGDGANDAAAIRLADVGLALGKHATNAAKDAADVVVTDNRIETIIDAIVEGRAMWASVRDAVAVLLGGNLGEIALTLGSELLLPGGSPLNARQLLLVNLFTDLVPALALAVRPPLRTDPLRLAEEGPEASLGSALTHDVLVRGGVTAAAGAVGWTAGRLTGVTRRRADTVALVSVIGSQLGQTFVAGWRDPLVVGSTLASGAALGVVVQTPGLSQFFGCRPLGPVGWTIGLGSAAGSAVAVPVVNRLVDLATRDHAPSPR